MKITQLSLFLENKPGHLRHICQALAESGINLTTLSLADTQQFGILRLIVQDWNTARKVLQEKGFVVNTTDVVATEVEDKPGGMARILEILETQNVNIEYMYAFTFHRGNKAVVIFRFDNPDEAIATLQKDGVNVLGEVDLYHDQG